MNGDPQRLLGVVLCGGRSIRMGRDKAELRTPGGQRFLELAVERLGQVCDDVCISGGHHRTTQQVLIADPVESHGPISGLVASLDHALENGFQACVFNPIDTPHLTAETLRSLVATYRSHRNEIICAVAGPQSGHLEPLIAVYPVVVADVFRNAIKRGTYGLQRILAEQDCVRVILPAHVCRNFNTPSDLTEL